MTPEILVQGMSLAAAFGVGLLGSGHCVGMCGAMALMPSGSSFPTITPLVYNLSRLTSYGVLGALVGALGGSLGVWLDIPFWSVLLRVATGAVVVIIGLGLLSGNRRWAIVERLGARLWRLVSPLARRAGRRRGVLGFLALGLLWGLLPCGLVYSMLLMASTVGSAGDGFLLMIAFGAGTLPSMAGMGLAGGRVVRHLRTPRARQMVGAALILGGVWIAAMPIWHATTMEHAHHGQQQQP